MKNSEIIQIRVQIDLAAIASAGMRALGNQKIPYRLTADRFNNPGKTKTKNSSRMTVVVFSLLRNTSVG